VQFRKLEVAKGEVSSSSRPLYWPIQREARALIAIVVFLTVRCQLQKQKQKQKGVWCALSVLHRTPIPQDVWFLVGRHASSYCSQAPMPRQWTIRWDINKCRPRRSDEFRIMWRQDSFHCLYEDSKLRRKEEEKRARYRKRGCWEYIQHAQMLHTDATLRRCLYHVTHVPSQGCLY
jgi:hypothetical protein